MIGQLWLAETSPGRRSGHRTIPGSLYVDSYACCPTLFPKHHRRAVDGKGDNDSVTIPLIPRIVRRVAAGNQAEAAELSIRRLQACGLRPMVTAIPDTNADQMKRTAAALVLPIDRDDVGRIMSRVLEQERDDTAGSRTPDVTSAFA